MSRYRNNRVLSLIPILGYDFDVTKLLPYPPDTKAFSILLDVARKTPHLRGTTPTSYIKWWCCVFRERVRPLAIRWSAMVACTSFFFLNFIFLCMINWGKKRLYTLNDPFIIDFSKGSLTSLIITEKVIENMGIGNVLIDQRDKCRMTPYTGAHTNLYPISLLLCWLFS